MPRIRTIKPKFWDDIKLSKVSRDARLLFVGLWNFSDDLAVVISDPVWIKSKIFPYDKLIPEQLEKWLLELVDKKFILPLEYEGEKYYYVKNLLKHQVINRPNYEEILIESQQLNKLIKDKSHPNHVLITETSVTNHESISALKERKGIGEDKEMERKGMEEMPENFSLHKIYSKDFKTISTSFRNLTEPGFLKWKIFVDFIIKNHYTEIFNCKFVNPQDFEKLDFPESKWDETLKSILSTGIKPEHNLYFRIPQFLKYNQNGLNGTKGGTQSKGGGLSGTSVVESDKQYKGRLGH